MTVLKIQKTANIGQITLNSPQTLNLIEEDTFEKIYAAIKDFEADNKIKLVLISAECGVSQKTGQKIFSAGVNLKNYDKKFKLLEENPELFKKNLEFKRNILKQINESTLPVIIAIDGLVIGGFFEFAMHCDIIIASESAEFCLNEVNIGLIPGYGGINKLLRITGKNKAFEILTSGRRINAQEANNLGIASTVFLDEDFALKAEEYAHNLANKPASSLMLIKNTVRDILNGENADATEVNSFMSAVCSSEAKENINKFLKKQTIL